LKLTKERGRQLREIFWDIVAHYGESRWQSNYFELNLYDDPDYNTFGECEVDYNEISCNVALCKHMRQAVETLIEEYIHYLQCPTWYTRYDNMYGYWDNPYEIRAKEIAKRDAPMFLSRD